MKQMKRLLCMALMLALAILTVSCGAAQGGAQNAGGADSGAVADSVTQGAESGAAADDENAGENADTPEAEKNGEVVILFTSDVHCGVDQGFGYAGLYEIRKTLEDQGFTTILVDNGDSIQGETLGLLTQGEAIIDLMNEMHYDVAIPGNHEYDYGMDRFLALTEKAEFPYISCNFTREDELVFAPYTIVEAAGMKIAFVGITTPETITSSTPKYFQNESGDFIYSFLQDGSGEKLYAAVQKAVDDARAEGVDYVYVMGHMGLLEESRPYTYADVISHTNGIDVFLDGHSHDSEQVVMKNKDGGNVVRSAVGTKMTGIGYSLIAPEVGIDETNIWSWPNMDSMPGLLGIRNEITDAIDAAQEKLEEVKNEKLGSSSVHLTVSDPKAKDASGNPVRMIRRAETNMGDFCADAFRTVTGADIGLSNGGGIRTDIEKGDVTYGDLISVHPFNNQLCVIEATGQQILDALEWGSSAVPDETGAFYQVSGMSYEINASIPSGCTEDANKMFSGIEGERRVKNVMVGDEPIDPEKTYTVAGIDYTLIDNGDGQTAFAGANVLERGERSDVQVLIDYLNDYLGGVIGEEYADPYGQGRITITEG